VVGVFAAAREQRVTSSERFLMDRGELTARIAHCLSQKLEPRGFNVLFDHADKETDSTRIGRIVSWIGPQYQSVSQLAFLDIAIVSRESDQAFALIEIEESTVKPKVILGDVLATLLGEQVTFQGKRSLKVGTWTTLIVFARGRTPQHQLRSVFLEGKLNEIRSLLFALHPSSNASVGRIVLGIFKDDTELGAKLEQQLEVVLPHSEVV
jgi:hypothetical protein